MKYIMQIFNTIIGSIVISMRFINSSYNSASSKIALDPNLNLRIKTSIIFAFLVVSSIIFGGLFFNMIALIASIMVFYEFFSMLEKDRNLFDVKKLIFALSYSVIPFASLITLRSYNMGANIVLWLMIIIWSTDCGAYFVGRKFGGMLLAPSISPGKTVSGAVGGIFASIITSIVLILVIKNSKLGSFSITEYIIITIIVSILAQIGDLIESKIKRIYQVKDSGTLIPGHGGFMDRLDSLTISAPFLLFVIFVA